MYTVNHKTRGIVRVTSAIIAALMLLAFIPQAVFAAEVPEIAANTASEFSVELYKTTAAGFEQVTPEIVPAVRRHTINNTEMYCLEDVAALTNKTVSVRETKEQRSVNSLIQMTGVVYFTFNDGAVYDYTAASGYLWKLNTIGDMIATDTVVKNGYAKENELHYVHADVLCRLFDNILYVVDNRLIVLVDTAEDIALISYSDKEYRTVLTKALFLLFAKDRTDGYEYVLKHCKKIKVDNNLVESWSIGTVWWNSRSIMHIRPYYVKAIDNGMDMDELAALVLHESTHCDTSTATNETQAVINETRCRIQLGQSREDVLNRLDSFDKFQYNAGIKQAKELYKSLFEPETAAAAAN